MPEALPDSKTHRLCFFQGAPLSHKHVTVPHFVADEVEELRAFVKFLYPPRGQDEYSLLRPDIHEPRWTVYNRRRHVSFTHGATPLEAVRNARLRLQDQTIGLILSSQCLTPSSSPTPSINATGDLSMYQQGAVGGSIKPTLPSQP